MAEILETVELGNTKCGESETPSSSSSVYHSSRIEGLLRSRTEYRTTVDFEIAASKDHWSELLQSSSVLESSGCGETQRAALSNGEIVESLRKQFPHSGDFFVDYGDRVQLGRKIAEGGQAEIFEGRLRGSTKDSVFKVFKESSSVLELRRQWPAGMLDGRTHEHAVGYWPSCCSSPIVAGTVLMNGRFAFQMMRFAGDLRKLIDMRMLCTSNAAPFSAKELERNMLGIALGMQALHNDNIVHRDLKAANVLVQGFGEGDLDSCHSLSYKCMVADFECSVGVVGTRFWRAPEILQGLKDHNITSDAFTKAVDVYSYGMTCYEMITGQLPFEGVRLSDYDVVLRGDRPSLPKEIEPWIHTLLGRCWHSDPNERPNFEEIVECIQVHCSLPREHEGELISIC